MKKYCIIYINKIITFAPENKELLKTPLLFITIIIF